MACEICVHPNRRAIEDALMTFNYGQSEYPLSELAAKFNVDLRELQVHAFMHTPLATMEGSGEESITEAIKKKEANALSAAAEDYLITMRQAGVLLRKRISEAIAVESLSDLGTDVIKGGIVPANVIELYLGAGNGLRQTMESLINMNAKINGENDSGTQALVDIVKAIRGSKE